MLVILIFLPGDLGVEQSLVLFDSRERQMPTKAYLCLIMQTSGEQGYLYPWQDMRKAGILSNALFIQGEEIKSTRKVGKERNKGLITRSL